MLPLAACGGGFGSIDGLQGCNGSTDVADVVVYPPNPDILPTSSTPVRLTAVARNACGDPISGVTFAWQSSNLQVATVDQLGRLNSASPSTQDSAVITATVASISGRAKPLAAATANASGQTFVTFAGGAVSDRTVNSVGIYPPQPVVAEGFTIQMTAAAYNASNQIIPDIQLSWLSAHSNIASVDASGKATGRAAGVTNITVAPTGASNIGFGVSIPLVVRGLNGGAPMPPEVLMSTPSLIMIPGETRDLFAQLKDPETGNILPADVQWTASTVGDVTLTVDPANSGHVTIEAVSQASLTVTARATYNGVVYVGSPVTINILRNDPTISGNWNEAQNPGGGPVMPDATAQHALAAVGDHLYYTGGYANGGPREQVGHAHMATNQSAIFTSDPLFRSMVLSDVADGTIQTVLNQCTIGNGVDSWPACMAIWRLADEPGVQERGACPLTLANGATVPCISRPTIVPNMPGKHDYYVRYQVHGHAMVGTDTHLYVVGGIDAQTDTGITGVSDINGGNPAAIGNTTTRFSDRTLIATVGADGNVAGWVEGPSLPPAILIQPPNATLVDVPGAYRPALVRYRDWLYLLGGWGWVERDGQKIGRNREEIFRATILADGSLSGWQQLPDYLPSPRNKHAAAVIGDRLVVSGGSAGADEFSADQVIDEVWYVNLDPATGDFTTAWAAGPPLPKALEFHVMVHVPGDNKLIVAGGDDLVSASREVYYLPTNPTTGQFENWGRLPLLPNNAVNGITALAGTGVGSVGGLPAKRLYVSGGGELVAGSDFQLTRIGRVYYIDLK